MTSAASSRATCACPAAGLASVEPFLVYSLGDVDYVCSDFEGPVGAGGNIWLNRVAVNERFVRDERGSLGVLVPSYGELSAIFAAREVIDGFHVDVHAFDYIWAPGATWNGALYGRAWNGARGYYEGASISGKGSVSLTELTVNAPAFEGSLVEAGGGLDITYSPSSTRDVTMGGTRGVTAPHDRIAGDLLATSDSLFASGGDNAALDVATRELALDATRAVSLFQVSASDVRGASRIVLTAAGAPAGAVLVVNVTDVGAVDWTDLGDKMVLEGGLTPDRVLWNFSRATSLRIAYGVVLGTVLAPRAAAAFWEGRVDGGLYVGALDGNQGGTPAPHGELISCGRPSGGQVNHWLFRCAP